MTTNAEIESLREALRVALRYIETETCGAPEGTIRDLQSLAYPLKSAAPAAQPVIPDELRLQLLSAMTEGLHAMVYGVYSTNSGNYAREALGDGGSIHEYVHTMLRVLPPRCLEQIQSGGNAAVAT